jgi:hypothetical protein
VTRPTRSANAFTSTAALAVAESVKPDTIRTNFEDTTKTDALGVALEIDPLDLLELAVAANRYAEVAADDKVNVLSVGSRPERDMGPHVKEPIRAFDRTLATFYCDYVAGHVATGDPRRGEILAHVAKARAVLAQRAKD